MTVDEAWIEVDRAVDETLLLSQSLEANLNGVYDDNYLHNALVTLIIMELTLYRKLATIFKNRSTSKIVEFASIARLLLESHATICWILDSEGNEQTRAEKFMETGWDLQKHYNNLLDKGYGLAKRTRSRLPSTETRMKTMGIEQLANWYDELNFYIHPSSAIVTQHSIGGISKTISFGTWTAGNVFADSIIKIAEEFNIDPSVKAKAEAVHELDITGDES